MNGPATLTLIVPDTEPATRAPDLSQAPPEDFEEQAVPGFVKRIFTHKTENVDLAPLKNGLNEVQTQVDGLLSDLERSTVAGFRLSTVEVSLGISGGGTIGVVTAGVEASMSLTFERTDK